MIYVEYLNPLRIRGYRILRIPNNLFNVLYNFVGIKIHSTSLHTHIFKVLQNILIHISLVLYGLRY